jgi:hypothetical protein
LIELHARGLISVLDVEACADLVSSRHDAPTAPALIKMGKEARIDGYSRSTLFAGLQRHSSPASESQWRVRDRRAGHENCGVAMPVLPPTFRTVMLIVTIFLFAVAARSCERNVA